MKTDRRLLLPATGTITWHDHEWTGQVLEGRSLTGLNQKEQEDVALGFMKQALENALLVAGVTNNLK